VKEEEEEETDFSVTVKKNENRLVK